MASSPRLRAARHTPLLLALCALLVIATTAGPAAAHGNPGNYVTAITSVQPAVPGLVVSAEPDGSFLTVTNRTGRTLVVAGYEHEAYLKITAQGTWENSRSPTAWMNAGGSEQHLPAGADARATPVWTRVSDSGTYRYHDQRIEWTGDGLPSVVAGDVNAPHLIERWTIDLTLDDTPVTVSGSLSWAPAGFGFAEIMFVLACVTGFAGVLAAIVVERRRRPTRTSAT